MHSNPTTRGLTSDVIVSFVSVISSNEGNTSPTFSALIAVASWALLERCCLEDRELCTRLLNCILV